MRIKQMSSRANADMYIQATFTWGVYSQKT